MREKFQNGLHRNNINYRKFFVLYHYRLTSIKVKHAQDPNLSYLTYVMHQNNWDLQHS